MREVTLKSGRSVVLRESCRIARGKYKINDTKSKGAGRIT